MDKVDAHKLGAEGRGNRGKMVIRLRQQAGMKAVESPRVVGVQVRTADRGLRTARAASEGGVAEEALGRPHGACRKLAMALGVWNRPRIVGSMPPRMVLPFAPWTRRVVQALIWARFGIAVPERRVGECLNRGEHSASRPVKRVLEQCPAFLRQIASCS
ncbi:MAG: winged helix-turn-helix domain-containing protein [Candidatus Accumulibacter sp.]|nr:winged helix-turn-helix domain-containing protein [Accumulibacter sp.]